MVFGERCLPNFFFVYYVVISQALIFFQNFDTKFLFALHLLMFSVSPFDLDFMIKKNSFRLK